MSFSSRIRDRGVFPQRRLELELGLYLGVTRRTEGVDQAVAGCVLTLLALLGHDVGYMHWRGRAGSAGPIPKRSQAVLARLCHMKDGRGGEVRLAGPDSVSSWVLAPYQIGIRKILFFFNFFYNLQTNLN
jgi:hypothetical protein